MLSVTSIIFNKSTKLKTSKLSSGFINWTLIIFSTIAWKEDMYADIFFSFKISILYICSNKIKLCK